MSSRRLLAIDPSLTCSGWALFHQREQSLLGFGKVRALPPRLALAARFEDLQSKFSKLLDKLAFAGGDLLICEAATTMRDPLAAQKVEQVRGIIETLARQRGAEVPGRINPRTVQYELLGMRGKQLPRPIVKQLAVHAVRRLYAPRMLELGFPSEEGDLLKNQDIVDAILLGVVCLSRVKSAAQGGLPLAEQFDRELSRRRAQRGLRRLAVG
jgi:Holliday junction resolvasome RuvABC endonuclease subunit